MNTIFYKDENSIVNLPIKVDNMLDHGHVNTQSNSIVTLRTYSTHAFLGANGPVICDMDNMDYQFFEIGDKYKVTTKYDEMDPVSVMYAWTLCIDGESLIIGRHMTELENALRTLSKSSGYQGLARKTMADGKVITDILNQLSADKMTSHILHIYTESLFREFQILSNFYKDKLSGDSIVNNKRRHNTFARLPHSPLSAYVPNIYGQCGVKFHDLGILTGEDSDCPVSHEYITPNTKLKETEIKNMESDAQRTFETILPYCEKYTKIYRIPMTHTGEVRNRMRKILCKTEPFSNDEKHKKNDRPMGSVWSRKQTEINKNMKPEDYARMRQIFWGGDVGCHRRLCGELLENQKCYDSNSAYTAMLVYMTYPIGQFEIVKKKYDIKVLLSNCDLIDIDRKKTWFGHFVFHNVRLKAHGVGWQSESIGNIYWPAYKCIHEKSEITSRYSGKLFTARKLDVYMCDIDFKIFNQCYTYDNMEIINVWQADAGLLNEELVIDLLNMYRLKTELKNVPDKEYLYKDAKHTISSVYGAAVTRIIDDEKIYTTEGWSLRTIEEHPEIYTDRLDEMTPYNTWLSYQIGVWVTAWQRYSLWSVLLSAEDRVAYRDTDSLIGSLSDDDFSSWEYFLKGRRKEIADRISMIKEEDFYPKDIHGKEYPLGSYDLEDDFTTFKTIGPKRYSGEHSDGTIKNAISGLPKNRVNLYVKKPEDLTNGLTWKPEESGLMQTAYNDKQPDVEWVDRDGEKYVSVQRHGMSYKPIGYSLTMRYKLSIAFSTIKNMQSIVIGGPDPTDSIFFKKALDKSDNL